MADDITAHPMAKTIRRYAEAGMLPLGHGIDPYEVAAELEGFAAELKGLRIKALRLMAIEDVMQRWHWEAVDTDAALAAITTILGWWEEEGV